MTLRLARRAVLGLACAMVLVGCAVPRRTPSTSAVPSWTGRLALNVEGQASESFSAGFELKGAPEAGELNLFHPLGGTIAALTWSPGSATLRFNGSTRQFPSLEALAREAAGAPLPVAALFDWLAGKATPIAGWEPDVSQVAEGRLRARRNDPAPPAHLRLVFER